MNIKRIKLEEIERFELMIPALMGLSDLAVD